VTHYSGHVWVTQEISSSQSSPFWSLNEKTRVVVHDLKTNSSCIAAYYRFSFPHGLGHGQAESFFKRLLKHYVGASLKGIDRCMGVRR